MEIIIRTGQTPDTVAKIRQAAMKFWGLELVTVTETDAAVPEPNAENFLAFADFLGTEYGLDCRV